MVMEEIELDIDGKVVRVSREIVGELAAAAAARAGISARHRELSILLSRALESGRASLDGGKVRALCAVLEEEHLGPAAAELLRAVA